MYNFTTLGATGRNGPDSNAGYRGTGLQDVQVNKGMQEWRVPFTGRFRVEACGASGGKGSNGAVEGRGAKISGNVTLTKGVKLVILVGQKGSTQSVSHPGSGGGGTSVVYSPQMRPLLVAGGGGGGGAGGGGGGGDGGGDGFPGNDGVNGSGNGAGKNGEGGVVCGDASAMAAPPDSGSGAGINGSGGCFRSAGGGKTCGRRECDKGGESFSEGGEGGEQSNCDGGFGGGGACESYPGGGGGYSGGGVDSGSGGGGGGSFTDDKTWSIIKGGCNEGDGYVTFKSED